MPKNKINYNLIVPLISTILMIIFIFSKATGILTNDYFDIFIWIVVVVTVSLWGISWMETQRQMNKPFFFDEKQPGSGLSQLPLSMKLGVGVLLALIFSGLAIGLGSPIIDLPQPFTPQALSTATDYDKVFFQSAIPGWFEEAAIFILVTAIKFILMVTIAKNNPRLFLIIILISAGLGAAVLTQAHRVVYGSDSGAYIGIFSFEFVVQFFNLYTGAFISWIPHIFHNGIVSLNFLIAFSLGGVSLLLLPLWRRRT